jgi:hypothetical protein
MALYNRLRSEFGEPAETLQGNRWIISTDTPGQPLRLATYADDTIPPRVAVWMFDTRRHDAEAAAYINVTDEFQIESTVDRIREHLLGNGRPSKGFGLAVDVRPS